MSKMHFNVYSDTITLSVPVKVLPDIDACILFNAMLDRAISIDESLKQVIYDSEVLRQINKILYNGKTIAS
jgi:hypothetical protein